MTFKFKCEIIYFLHLVLSLWIVTSNSESHPGATSHFETDVKKNEPFCRITRNIKTRFQKELSAKIPKDIDCYLDSNYGNCSSVSCTSESLNVTAGLNINVCGDKPSIKFWADSPLLGSWSQEVLVSKNEQKVDIKFSREGLNNTDPLLYLIVNLESHEPKFGSHNLLPNSLMFLSLEAKLTNVTAQSVSDGIYPIRVINRTEFHLSQVCDLPVPAPPENYRKANKNPTVTSSEQSFEMYNPVKRASLSTSVINRPCDPNDIFSCGTGATCRVQDKAAAFCECLTNFVMTSNGSCEFSASPTADPTVQPSSSSTSNTYSSVMGAFLSVIVLVVVAAGIFFGTKYHMFSRIRSRFSSGLSLWPFRDSTLDDQVVMVDPLAPDDDDPPLF